MELTVRLFPMVILTALTLSGASVGAQGIPRTIAAAEAEGRVFPHAESTAPQPAVVTMSFRGTSERRCVAPPVDDSVFAGALRSGEMIARAGQLVGQSGIRSGRGHKILWLPLYSAVASDERLLIRASRVGSRLDSLEQTIAKPVHSHGSDGYPSRVEFPLAGQWLVIATAGGNWGCFMINVGE